MPAPTKRTAPTLSPAERPVYFISEAATYLHLPARTVRDWVLGRQYPTATNGDRASAPLIRLADPKKNLLSFSNLVELHVVASVRRGYKIKAKYLRKAIEYLGREFGTRHPLLHEHMLTDGTRLFIERYGTYVDISANGQTHIKEALDAHLKRIEWDEAHAPVRLYPFTRPDFKGAPQLVVIDPRVRFGQPCITGTGVPTNIIYGRYKAGDAIAALVADYGRTQEEIEEAVRYESGAAA